MVFFIISGLCHGSAYTYLIWGALHGVCMVVEREIYGDKIKLISNNFSLANLLRWGITFLIISFALIFFRIDNLSDIMTIFEKIFTSYGMPFKDTRTMGYALMFMLLIFIVDFTDEYLPGKIKLLNSRYKLVRWCTYIAMVV